MKENNLKLAQKDIDEALVTIESMEKTLVEEKLSKDDIKDKFLFLTVKIQELEQILKDEGIID
ncbi:hypothetical protein JMF89_01385 [Clostridiaceae bacterium UIB06]|uniref:Uncharacterized protein n=1 Tax=Clostridium thailandense TaxID=2794346 RepID=A0A949TLK7_9CLOT|nr:hypothetical protein [Clostridium thailandense]MBV7272702.1 hypothetical protein [Clostridium thailandense]MCH5135868.1 hypothetical protein [Clostridiaceae bacterium UIB06]